jgi:hypothetical protein
MEIYDVVKKLTGPIVPIGETNTDEVRLNNLLTMLATIDYLINEVRLVAFLADRQEYSIHLAGKTALDYLKDLKSAPDSGK